MEMVVSEPFRIVKWWNTIAVVALETAAGSVKWRFQACRASNLAASAVTQKIILSSKRQQLGGGSSKQVVQYPHEAEQRLA